jgi:hypothetical protein
MTEIVPVKMPAGHGCDGCVYVLPKSQCSLIDSIRDCSRVLHAHKYELIYTTPEKAALMRLRGQTYEKD